MLSTSKVMAGYAPDEIAATFNDITQVAPRIADRQMLIRSALKRHLT